MAASKNPKARLLHILEEIDGIAATIEGMDYPAYRESYVAARVALETSYATNIINSTRIVFGISQPTN